ncbi:MAG: tyrosine-protein phosphatase [Hyphomonas sp.]|uniref:tyrosine-protein phosphatase n=1 Tax=Hyphomonas sp. TaxID=87 RepID=UPI00352999BB
MKYPISVFASTMAATLVSCAISPPEAAILVPAVIEEAQVIYDDGAYSLDWTTTGEHALVDVFVSESPDGADAIQIADDITDGELTWTPAEDRTGRTYFVVQPEGGEPYLTAVRLLPLEGGRNFRDLGGYETADGRHVKWGRLFRSGTMTRLTDEDYKYLSGLGIATVVDLRTSQERTAEPTDWKAGSIDYVTFADPVEEDANPLAAVFASPDVTPEDVRATMTALYSGILDQQTPAYRRLFLDLVEDDAPLAFNCSAGKDRTGVGAALILSALGVPRDTVVADYALSEKLVDYSAEFKLSDEAPVQEDGPYTYLRKLPPELVAPLMRSDPAYIESVLDHIDATYGSVDAYIQQELGVDETQLAALRQKLLED